MRLMGPALLGVIKTTFAYLNDLTIHSGRMQIANHIGDPTEFHIKRSSALH